MHSSTLTQLFHYSGKMRKDKICSSALAVLSELKSIESEGFQMPGRVVPDSPWEGHGNRSGGRHHRKTSKVETLSHADTHMEDKFEWPHCQYDFGFSTG